MNFWIFGALALIGVGAAVGAMLLGLTAFAVGSDAGQVAALGFEVAALVVTVFAVREAGRC